MTQDEMFEDPNLQDPDANTSDSKYSWDEDFQRHVCSLLLSDKQFLLQSLDLIKPSYFTNKAHSKIVSIVFDFFKKYRILPRKDFLVQEIKTQFKESSSNVFYLTEVNILFDYFQPGMEAREYLRDKIVFFAKIQSIKKAFHDSLQLIDKSPESDETWDKVYEQMRLAMQTQQNFELGIDYFKEIQDRYKEKDNSEEDKERFVTGLESVDTKIGGHGYSVGEVLSIVAGPGVGKSTMLANITKTNLLRGKKGIYISLELSEDKVADRLDAIFSDLPIQNLIRNKDELFDKIKNLKNVVLEGDIWPLVIKQFPAGTATVNTIKSYIGQLRFQGFDPNFIILDYVGEMSRHADMPSHESMELIVRELRGMASEEKVFVATAMQPNRESKKDNKSENSRIDDEHLAGSFGQIRPLDGCISLNQNDNEKKLGIGRGYVIKQRDGESRYQFYLKFDKMNLQITEIQDWEYGDALNKQKNYASDEMEIDKVMNKRYKPKDSENNS